MLSYKVLTPHDVSRAATYYEDGADDYYVGEGEASEWQGAGAEMLGRFPIRRCTRPPRARGAACGSPSLT